mmetsp:Transcript_115610/g.313939  ORF Transcript_115610/g.313939 Transcript_115610/m.313939 type:complete len:106 (+) Transcript_115610:2-319(+)
MDNYGGGGVGKNGELGPFGDAIKDFRWSEFGIAVANPAVLLVSIVLFGSLQEYGPFRSSSYEVDPCKREASVVQQKFFGQTDCRSAERASTAECLACKARNDVSP